MWSAALTRHRHGEYIEQVRESGSCQILTTASSCAGPSDSEGTSDAALGPTLHSIVGAYAEPADRELIDKCTRHPLGGRFGPGSPEQETQIFTMLEIVPWRT